MNMNSFYQKIKFKYRLSILNENTLEEISHLRLSVLNLFLFVFSIALVYFFIIAFVIIKTPLKGFIPGYSDNIDLPKQLLLDAVAIDSIAQVVQQNTEYLETVKKVLSNDVTVDSATSIKLLTEQEKSNAKLEASAAEESFRQKYEEEEKVNVVSVVKKENHNYLMATPVKGSVLHRYNPADGVNGVVILSERKESVRAVLDGVVIFVGFAYDNSYVLQVQHVDDLVSIYKTKEPFFKKVGEKVHCGEIVSTFVDDLPAYEVRFELWKSGKSLDPESYITFE